ncbi:MAG: ATP-grasp fold amidoligase family protein, partial [Gemmatimonadota bacterium]
FVASVAPELRIPETYAVFRSAEALVGFNLSQPYVAKPTHSSGVVVLKPDGGSLSEPEIAKLRRSMGRSYYLAGGEIQYKYLPRKIIVEEFVGQPPTVAPDFKLQFFEGAFQHCYVLLDRHTDPRPLFIDEEGTPISMEYRTTLVDSDLQFYEGPFQAPDRYQEMIRIGGELSKPFSFCRVDMFPQDGEIFFGELTFSPGNCLYSYLPKSFMAVMHADHRSG